MSRIALAGAEVLGVSRDSIECQRDFAARNDLPYRLLSDEPGTIAEAWGVAGGLLRFGLPQRVTFLVSPEGTIVRRFEPATPAGHAAEVIAALGGETQTFS